MTDTDPGGRCDDCDWYDGRIPVTPSQLQRRRGPRSGPTVFTTYWLWLVVAPEHGGALKYVVAVVWAFFTAGTPVYGVAWQGLLAAWVLDMVSGVVASLRDRHRRFDWSKFGDGFLKLIIILGLPPVIYHVGEGWGIGAWLAGVVLGLLGFELTLSALRNAVTWWPGLRPLEALLVRIRERGENQVEEAIVVIDERKWRRGLEPPTDDGEGHKGQ